MAGVTLISSLQTCILYVALAALGACVTAAVLSLVWKAARTIRTALSTRDCIIVFAACAACSWAAQKGRITFPRTDPTVAYITDNGSYVTNDLVHVDFTRVIVPTSATWYLDRREVTSTNDTDWTTHATGTFAEINPPMDFPYQTATNFNWMFYTDWTPGPSVITNGVWHAFWGLDNRQRRFFIPVRTCVRDGSRIIATPKSKEDSHED